MDQWRPLFMNEDDILSLPNIETMVIPAKAEAKPEAAPWAATSAAAPQAASSPAARSDDFTAAEGSSGVCAEAPAAAEPSPVGAQGTPAVSIGAEPIKLNGREHPWKPRTQAQRAEFAALWRDLSVPVPAIARRYRCGERTVQMWRAEFGLPGRDELARARDVASSRKPSLVLEPKPSSPASTAMGPAPGSGAARPADPLEVPEIAALLVEIGDEARRMTPTSDLRPLRRKFQKLAALTTASAPHNWASLHALAQEQGRALVWAEHCEAKLPKPEVDQAQLRKDAALQMMHELRSVLPPEEQALLARVVKHGADLLMARGRGASGPVS